MERRGVTQREAAKASGMTFRTFWNKLHGIGDFTVTEAIAVHQAYFKGIPMEELFSWE